MAIHTIDTLRRLGEYQLLDALLAHFAIKAVSVIGLVASHDSLVQDGLAADIAAVGAIRAYW